MIREAFRRQVAHERPAAARTYRRKPLIVLGPEAGLEPATAQRPVDSWSTPDVQ